MIDQVIKSFFVFDKYFGEEEQCMADFADVSFNGVFRDYQRRVLDNSLKFLGDNKINIVAAPGSGKTVLGLERILMR